MSNVMYTIFIEGFVANLTNYYMAIERRILNQVEHWQKLALQTRN